jgi:YHS domain-containing protein
MKINDTEHRDESCKMCGKNIGRDQNRIQTKAEDGSTYFFHSAECANLFKKFQSVYGTDFIIELK